MANDEDANRLRLSLSFSGADPLRDTLETAAAVERAGLDGVWYCEHVGWHDAVVPASLMLDRHPRMEVGIVGPAPVSRHGAVLAMELSSLGEIAPGRIRAQLGLGGAGLMRRIGGGSSSLALVREYVESVRATLTGRPVSGTWAGHEFDDFQLRSPVMIPLDVMAIRPRMLELAATIADGVSLSTGASVEYITHAVERVERVLREAGRPRESFRISAQAIGSVFRDPLRSAENAASRLARFSPEVLAILAPGLDPTREARRMSIAGTPESIGERIAEYAAAGVDEVAVNLQCDPGLLEVALTHLAQARHDTTIGS